MSIRDPASRRLADGQQPPTAAGFADRLHDRIARVGSGLCVGLDPVIDRLPPEVILKGESPATAIARFDEAVIDAVKDLAAAVKFQSACYERYGSGGWDALAGGIELARANGLIVILDGKRGDIGISAAHYAQAARALDADAVTANPYLGLSGLTPFLDQGLGVFALVRTSNPDSDPLQTAPLASGLTVAEFVAAQIASLGAEHVGFSGLSGLGAVIGATKADGPLAARLRAAMPDQVFLIPGVGAQGGRIEDLAPLLRPDAARFEHGPGPAAAGLLVTMSRSIIYAYESARGPWTRAVAAAARRMADDLRALIP